MMQENTLPKTAQDEGAQIKRVGSELAAIREAAQRQNRLLQRQNRALMVCMGACALIVVLLLVAVVGVVPHLSSTLENMDAMSSDLALIAEDLKDADISGTMSELDDAMVQVVETLEALDIETLNRAIGNLADIIEPLARIFG